MYVPGAGWRGFDPRWAAPVDDRYITLATSSKPGLAAAVNGSYSGPHRVESELTWSVEPVLLEDSHLAAESMEALRH